MTHLSAVPDQKMMRRRPLRFRNDVHQPVFHLIGRFPFCKTQSVGAAEHVRIHGDRVAAECDRINDVRGLTSDARKRL